MEKIDGHIDRVGVVFFEEVGLLHLFGDMCSATHSTSLHMQHEKKIAATILSTAISRGVEKSTCPSEIARLLFPDDWRRHMKDVLAVAIDLHNEGSVLITQKGTPVDVQNIRGPIRIKIV